MDRGIVMAGGGAMIRGLDVLLSQETSLPIRLDDDPLTCVVRGTGRILDDNSGGVISSARRTASTIC